MKYFKLLKNNNLKIIKPCNYFDFLSLLRNAKIVLTDSGGIQEEAFKNSCITIRKNTERPETIIANTNILTSYSPKKINIAINKKFKKENYLEKYIQR